MESTGARSEIMLCVHFLVESDPSRFAARVMPFLEAEVERNLPATILLTILGRSRPAPVPILVCGLDDVGEVAVVAQRTPPFPMICTSLPEGQAGALLEVWLRADPMLDGLNAPAPTARALAAAWEQRTGGIARPRTSMALHSLTRVVDPPHPAAGDLRSTTEADVPLLVDWTIRFAGDAHTRIGAPEEAVRVRMAADSLWLWLNEHDRPVSMVGASPPVAGVPRISPVYTPPLARRRGYAGTAVAAVSRVLLSRGARACLLFTDLANPTSNKIYGEVGYRAIGEWQEYSLSDR